MDQLRATNLFVTRHEPWTLAKRADDDDSRAWLRVVLAVAMDTTRRAAILLQPLVPETAERILDRLNVPRQRRSWADASVDQYVTDTPLGNDVGLIFKRLDDKLSEDSLKSRDEPSRQLIGDKSKHSRNIIQVS